MSTEVDPYWGGVGFRNTTDAAEQLAGDSLDKEYNNWTIHCINCGTVVKEPGGPIRAVIADGPYCGRCAEALF